MLFDSGFVAQTLLLDLASFASGAELIFQRNNTNTKRGMILDNVMVTMASDDHPTTPESNTVPTLIAASAGVALARFGCGAPSSGCLSTGHRKHGIMKTSRFLGERFFAYAPVVVVVGVCLACGPCSGAVVD